MKTVLAAATLMLIAFVVPSLAQAVAPIRIILVGSSTMTPHTGWGGSFCSQHLNETVACLNLARGGRSTRTYRTEGSWDLVLDELKVVGYRASYVLIEMGHNDKSINPTVATDLKTEFPSNLRRFVEETRALGGTPVLVTPLSTRHFRNKRILNTLVPWAEQVQNLAKETAVPVVDLSAESAHLFQRLGAEGSMSFSAVPPTDVERQAAEGGTTLPARLPKATPLSNEAPGDDPRRKYTQDYIHLNAKGADAISSIFASRLNDAIPELRHLIIP